MSLSLVSPLYEAAFDPESLSQVLGKITDRLGCHFGMIADMRLDPPGYAMRAYSGVPEEAWRLFESRFGGPDTNPWIRGVMLYKPGLLIDDSMLPGKGELGGTEFWTNLISPLDCERCIGGVTLVDRDLVSFVSIYRSERRRSFGEKERRTMGALLPHLSRTAAMRARLSKALAERDAALDALHRLGLATILLDADGAVVFANREAEDLLARRDGLLLSRGRLRCSSTDDDKRLAAAVAGSIETASGRGQHAGANLLVSRQSGKRALQVSVAPTHGGRLSGAARARVVVFVGDPDKEPVNAALSMREMFGFSSKEAAVAAELCRGGNLPEIADALGVSHNTVRTHVARMLDETGARRQTDLVRLLLSIPTVNRSAEYGR